MGSAVPRSNVGEVETAAEPKHRADDHGGRDRPPPARRQAAVRHQQKQRTQGQCQAGQPPPVVEPGRHESTGPRARIGHERPDGIPVEDTADHPPKRRARQHPGDPMLVADGSSATTRSARSRRSVRGRATSCTRPRRRRARAATRKAADVRAKTARPNCTLRPRRASGTASVVATASITSASPCLSSVERRRDRADRTGARRDS